MTAEEKLVERVEELEAENKTLKCDQLRVRFPLLQPPDRNVDPMRRDPHPIDSEPQELQRIDPYAVEGQPPKETLRLRKAYQDLEFQHHFQIAETKRLESRLTARYEVIKALVYCVETHQLKLRNTARNEVLLFDRVQSFTREAQEQATAALALAADLEEG